MSDDSHLTKAKAKAKVNTQIKTIVILVLGMHRSGTSALTRVLNLLGVDLGKDLLPSAADNQAGFWENARLVSIHETLLAALGRTWDDLRLLPDGWLTTDACRDAQAALSALIEEEFADTALWAVKDPRLCMLLPLWEKVLSEHGIQPRVVMVLRHPDEVAHSLAKRESIDLGHAHLLWLRYMADAELHSRSLPRVAVRYGSLLSDWMSVAEHVCHALSIVWPKNADRARTAIDAFLDEGLRHHTEADQRDGSGRLPELIHNMHVGLIEAARRCAAWELAQAATDEYSRVAATFDGALTTGYVGRRELAAMQRAVSDTRRQHEAWLAGLAQVVDNMQLQTINALTAKERGELAAVSDTAALYFAAHSGEYVQSQAVFVAHDGLSAPTRLVFELPADVVFQYVRFDPAQVPGVFLITGLRVNGIPVEDIRSCVAGVRQFELLGCGESELRIAALDGDPQVDFDLRTYAGKHAVGTVELTCWRLDLAFGRSQLVQTAVQEAVKAAAELGRVSTMESQTAVQEAVKAAAELGHVSIMESQAKLLNAIQGKIDTIGTLLEADRSRLDKVADSVDEVRHWQQLSAFRRWREKKLNHRN